MSPPLATYHFNLTVNSRQEAKIRIMAKERGLPFETYCQMFFEAAYAAKVGLCPDAGLDARVRAAMILVGASVPASEIAGVLGMSEKMVERIAKAVRAEIKGREAA